MSEKPKPITSIRDLTPDDGNANRHTQRGGGLMHTSVSECGFGDSLTVDRNGKIISGNQRAETLAELEMLDAVVVQTDGTRPVIHQRTDLDLNTDVRAKRLAILQNRVGETNLEWDAEVLAALAADGVPLDDLWSHDELTALLEGIERQPEPGAGGDEFDGTPQDGPTRVQPGELWQCGPHRLLCGDSTKAEDVARLMGGERADAAVMDSPYGMDVKGVENDSETGLEALFAGILRVLPVSDGVVVNFQGARLFWKWTDAVRNAGHKFERSLWLYKPNDGTYPWRGWLQTGQMILLSSVGKPKWGKGDFKHDTYVVNFVGDELEKLHATPKPLEVIEHLVRWTSPPESLVYDPFLGSGTTLIAAHRTGRRCYGVELSPAYCDVILRRYDAETGDKPVRVE